MELSGHSIYLIPIAGFFAGFVDAVAGGGGLISLPALLATGMPPQVALGTNKCIGIATASASSIRYTMSRMIDRSVLPVLALGVAAGGLGALTASKTRPELLRPVILIGLVAVGIFLLIRRNFGLHPKPDAPKHHGWLRILVIAIGFYDGFFGPGTGTFLMMSFVSVMGFSLLKASAHGRLVNLCTNFGALAVFLTIGHVEWRLALPAAAASFLGGTLGASWALKHGSKAVRPVFLIVTWGLIAKVAWDTLH